VRTAGKEDVLMIVNDPDVVAELEALYPRYEQALVSNDVETLMGMFWASPYVSRFGPTESLYGIDEINAFRKGRSPANLAREVKRLDMVTFGKDFAVVNLAFERVIGEKVTRGRQSQTWARLPEGWRIVTAHISTLT
jgi:predicted small integral membrane protein